MVLEVPSTPLVLQPVKHPGTGSPRTVSSISKVIRLSGRRLSLKAKALGPHEPVLCRLQSVCLRQILYLPPTPMFITWGR